jgi:squalene-hopene/tetraprenyl-beta-curcumene cyclase
MARPALRAALGESTPTDYETGLYASLRARNTPASAKEIANALKNDPSASQSQGVESVLAALFFARASGPNAPLSADAKQALDRMWSLSIREGDPAGAWSWFNLKLDPWEMPESRFYGATLAAMAVGSTPQAYRDQPEVAERIKALVGYLDRTQDSQPLHNRMMLLWASMQFSAVMDSAAQKRTIAEVLSKQSPDGGWSIQSLGPWQEHADAPPSKGSNGYATAVAAFVLREAGVPPSDARLAKGLNWLRTHQDKSGSWAASSMNKKYEEPMQASFMRDAATAFAVMALVERTPSASGGRAE